MNKHDRDNLNFILTADKHTLDQWWEELSEDDKQYALELIRMARTETEVQLIDCNESILENGDYSEALAVLKKFML